jgi:hypothetical protein
MKKLTLTAAFAQFGAELTNPRWQCSAIAKDGSLVVSCWSDALKPGAGGHKRYEYSKSLWGEGNRPGRNRLWRHLRTAFDHSLPIRLVIATLDRREDFHQAVTDASPLPKTFSTEPNLVGRSWSSMMRGSPSSFDDPLCPRPSFIALHGGVTKSTVFAFASTSTHSVAEDVCSFATPSHVCALPR